VTWGCSQLVPKGLSNTCQGTLKGVALVGGPSIDEGQDCGGRVIHSPRKGWSGFIPLAEIGGMGGPRVVPYGTSRACMRSGYGGHMRGSSVGWGSPSRIDTHGEFLE